MRLASSPISLVQRLDPSRRLRLDARQVINLSVLLLSVIVVVLVARTGWRSVEEYRQARQVERVNAVANDFMAAAEYRELERTYAGALLAGTHSPLDERQRLIYARRQGDLIWGRAMDGARALAVYSPMRSDLLARLSTTESSFNALRAIRKRLDACLDGQPCELHDDAWQRAATRQIEDSGSARNAMHLMFDMPDRLTRLYVALQGWVWVITEHTRQQRGMLALYLSQRRVPPAAARAQLEEERRTVADAQENLRAFSSLRSIDPAVRTAIREADHAISAGFEPLTAAVESGGLQLDWPSWLSETAPAAGTLDHLSATVNSTIAALAAGTMRRDRADLYINGFFILLAGALAALSVTKVRQTANALFYEKELAEVTIRSIGDAVITTDSSGRVEYINPAAELLTGWRIAEAKGLSLEQVFKIFDGVTLEPQRSPIEICLQENRVVSLDNNTVLMGRDGTRRYIEDSAAPIRDRSGKVVGGVLVFFDATEVHQTAHLIEYRATHDSLTDLFNRREFEHRLAALLARGRNDSSGNALLVLDLDQFEVVNESCGHLAGDRLLREVARILKEHTRDSDVLARLGGDEFGLIIRDCTLDEAREAGESLRAAVSAHSFEWEGVRYQPRVTIGLMPFHLDVGAPVALLSHGYTACHIGKEKGRDRLHVYDAGDRDIEQRSGAMHWIARLNHALAEGRFTLYCQPVLPVHSRIRRHGEVLVRMLDPDGKLLPPAHFIPHAERYGLMPRLDRWVIHQSLAALGELYVQGRGREAGVLAINLSGATLSESSMAEFIQEEIRVFAVPPDALCFEITETAAVESLAEASALISSLRRMGCAFSLDDFGRGMSSLMYLKQLPVDYLKIDGEFVRGMQHDPVCKAMVKTFHALGQAMDIPTIAECVENASVRRQLETLGVDYLQGFAIAPPQPLSQYLQSAAS